uniref:Uncharacterized protein n=1 Tax=Arundo donax TaxID=35708 RepID=A0A0A9HA21_ARUDO
MTTPRSRGFRGAVPSSKAACNPWCILQTSSLWTLLGVCCVQNLVRFPAVTLVGFSCPGARA